MKNDPYKILTMILLIGGAVGSTMMWVSETYATQKQFNDVQQNISAVSTEIKKVKAAVCFISIQAAKTEEDKAAIRKACIDQ